MNLPVNEPLRLAQWQDQNLYGQIRAARAGAEKYILHDGPPYANGAIHLGHALNKCIKDFVVKTKTMAGFDAPFVPGWEFIAYRPPEALDWALQSVTAKRVGALLSAEAARCSRTTSLPGVSRARTAESRRTAWRSDSASSGRRA